MRKQVAKPDELIAQIAGRQHGVVTYEQLCWAGLVPSAITRRVRAGHLHRLYRGVYAVGHTDLKVEGRWIAAVFAYGEGAVLSHESAAHLWKLSPTGPSTIHVTVSTAGGRRKRSGIRLHYSTTLTPADVTRRRNIPVTTPARTRADLGYDEAPTRSDLERLFLRICGERGIPKPEVNVKVGPHRVDFLWRPERLIVETDSWKYHSDRRAFEADRVRDRELRLRGYAVLRFTDRELSMRPNHVSDSPQAHLGRRTGGHGQKMEP